MSSEDHWEVLPLEWPFSDKKMAKIQRKWPQFATVFRFGRNFLYDACFSIPFSLVTYICSILCSGTHIDHHFGYFLAIFCGAIMVNFSKLTIMAPKKWLWYGHRCVLYGCLHKEGEKCRSPMKTNLKNMHRIKSYGQNKIRSQIMAISFVFLPYFCPKMATPEEALPNGPQSSSLYFWNQWK